MKMKKIVLDFLFYFTIGILCAFSISLNSLTATVMESEMRTIIIYTFGFMTFFYFWFYNKHTFVAGVIIFVIGTLLFAVMVMRSDENARVYGEVKAAIDGIVNFILGSGAYEGWYGSLLEIFIMFLISIVVASTIKNWLGFYAITALGTITIMIPALNNWEKSNLGRYLFLVCFIVLLLEKLNYFLLGDKAKDNAEMNYGYAIMSLPLALILILGSLFLPKFELEDFTKLDKINEAGQVFVKTQTDKKDLAKENKRLGGPLVQDDEVVMEVKSEKPVYLKSTTLTTYNGDSWFVKRQRKEKLEANDKGNYIVNPYKEMESAEQLKNELGTTKKEVTIIPDEKYPTKNIFIAPFPDMLQITGEENTLYTNENDILWTAKTITNENEYTQTYWDWEYDSEAFQLAMRSKATVAPSEYLEVASTVTDRVKELTKDITKDSVSNYAKMRAIESYLRTNYPYTLETGELPPGEDFIDYFLFTEKQGYCVYYASAMAVMGRIEGIPTRYVEGYVMPAERNENGNYTVTNKQAHAWVEAYFSGFGWVKFEPTSAYLAGDILIPIDETGLEEAINQEMKKEQENQPPQTPEHNNPINEPENSDTDKTKNEVDKKPINKMFVAIPTGLAVIVLLVILIKFLNDYRKNKVKYVQGLEARPKSQQYFIYITRILKTMGYSINSNETYRDFTKRIQPEFKTNISGLNEVFDRSTYSKLEITTNDSIVVEEIYYNMLDELSKSEKSNKLKVFFQRFLLMFY